VSKNGNPSVQFPTRPARVYLTGFMGAGKSTVGPLLADLLGWSFQDTDQWIEKTTGVSVSSWIEKQGELEFRRIEAQALREVSKDPRQVIALGGGAIQTAEGVSWVKAQGWLIFLSADLDSLLKRLSSGIDQRPLLKKLAGQIDQQSLLDLLQKRENYYHQADFKIQTDQKDPGRVAAELKNWLMREIGQ